jgi:hypothetical protein
METLIVMNDVLSVGEVARELGVKPADVSNLFYRRVLPDESAPIVAGRRMISADQVDNVRAALRRAGKIPATTKPAIGDINKDQP